jgi:hypothetical protein
MLEETKEINQESQSIHLKLAQESAKTNEQVLQILENQIQDAVLLKSLVYIENRSGILVILFSAIKGDILEVYTTFGNSPLINRIRTFEKQEQFFLDIIEVIKSGGMEKALSERIARSIYKNVLNTALLQCLPKIQRKDFEDVKNLIQNAINLELKIRTTKANIDYEKINSVVFRTENSLNKLLPPITNPYLNSSEEVKKITVPVFETDPEKLKIEKQISELQQGFQKVIMCKTLVSPVAGIEFSNLKENTKLLFMLPFQTEEEITFAKSMGAVNKDGQIKPISGTFFKLISGNKNEYHIFAKGPNGVLFRAFEERPVRLATPKKVVQKKEENSELSGVLSIVVGVVIVLISILVFIYLS